MTTKTYLDDAYHTDDVFYCDTYPCARQGRRFTFTPETWATVAVVVHYGPDGTVKTENCPACPGCGNHVEESYEDAGPSDYSERMSERSQMGLVRF